MMNDAPLILYSTEGCHLCEEAEDLLRAEQDIGSNDSHKKIGKDTGLTWEVVDIAFDDELFARYGWLIPVLRKAPADASHASSATDGHTGAGGEHRADANELRWPFDAEMLRDFLTKSQA